MARNLEELKEKVRKYKELDIYKLKSEASGDFYLIFKEEIKGESLPFYITKGIFHKISPQTLFAAIYDKEHRVKWQNGLKEFKVIEELGDFQDIILIHSSVKNQRVIESKDEK